MMHIAEPGWFYAYGYYWKQIPHIKPHETLSSTDQVALHFQNTANRKRAKNKHGLFCECKDCLAGMRLVNKGWRPDKS